MVCSLKMDRKLTNAKFNDLMSIHSPSILDLFNFEIRAKQLVCKCVEFGNQVSTGILAIYGNEDEPSYTNPFTYEMSRE